MLKNKLPQELCIDLLPRSICNVAVAAVIVDSNGRVSSWAWNHCGEDGLGECAERAAVKRCNPRRLAGSDIYIAGWWHHSKNWVAAIPCSRCMAVLKKRGIRRIYHTRKDGSWAAIVM